MEFQLQITGFNRIPRQALPSFEEIVRDLDTVITDLKEEVQPGAAIIRLDVRPVVGDEPRIERLCADPALRMSFSILDEAEQIMVIPALKRSALEALFYLSPSRVVLIRMPFTGNSDLDDFEGHPVTDIVLDFTDNVLQILSSNS